MEEDESKSQSPDHEGIPLTSAYVVRLQEKIDELEISGKLGLINRIRDIIKEIEQNENFSELTAEVYDQKTSYLKSHLSDLPKSLHKVLIDEIRTIKLLLLQSESQKAKIIELLKELETSKEKVKVSDDVIRELKNQHLQDIRSNDLVLDFKTQQIDSQTKKISGLEEKLSLSADEISKLDNQITKLNQKNKQYTSEITQLKNTHKAKENSWGTTIGKLRKQLEGKGESVDDLSKKLEALMLEKDEVGAQLETLQAEKCSQDILFQEMETRLKFLQSDHAGVVSSYNNAQKVTNELNQRVLELEREVDMQREVITVRGEEKREAIRQLSASLEHYQSRYEELRKAFVSKNSACCFDFLR